MDKLDFDSRRIDIPCGGCGTQFTQTIGWLKHHGAFTCACGARNVVDSTKFDQGVANAQCATPTTKAQLRLLKNPAPTPTITVPAL